LYTESVFLSGIGQYFSVFTIPIPAEKSVGTFRYQKGGSGPLFSQKGGMTTKKGGTIPTENTDTEPI